MKLNVLRPLRHERPLVAQQEEADMRIERERAESERDPPRPTSPAQQRETERTAIHVMERDDEKIATLSARARRGEREAGRQREGRRESSTAPASRHSSFEFF
eukprot:scaffold139009_cov29-Tisochrysis_lutea.AAC.8